MRDAEAMKELVSGMIPERRPARITYVASGSHLAPLILCDQLPAAQACEIVMTEIDANVQQGISEELATLEEAGCIRVKDPGSKIVSLPGERVWQLDLDGRNVVLKLRLTDPSDAAGLFSPQLLRGRDLLISHDWAGDPLGNLQVIREYLAAARALDTDPPLLMIADLQAHPYPVDLEFFGVVARSGFPYGHRDSDGGVGRHGRIELGTPVFGGAVLLDFKPPWWREMNDEELDAFFNFLLFNQFDLDRRNVITGGADPMLAPGLLDWYTGFGARDIRGRFLRPDGAYAVRMLEAAAHAGTAMDEELRERLGCRIELFRTLMALRAAGVDTLDLMPAARFERRPVPGDFPDGRMESLYHEALRKAGTFRNERAGLKDTSDRILERIDADENIRSMRQHCPPASSNVSDPESLKSHYKELLTWLDPAR